MALIHVSYFSEILGMSTQMEVILPQIVSGQVGVKCRAEKRYPVLYLLHGMTDNHTTWLRKTSIERYAEERNLAVVMPNAHLSWYTDMKCGYRYYTHIAKEIPKICSRFFPGISDRREDTFVAGNSMGGYGAFKLALSDPERFGAAVSLSGGLDACTCKARNQNSYYPALWEDIFGAQEEIPKSGNDLFFLSEKLEKKSRPRLYMWCGTEDFLYEQNVRMGEHLARAGYDLVRKESTGDHSWKCWDIQIQGALDWLLRTGREGEEQDGIYASGIFQ